MIKGIIQSAAAARASAVGPGGHAGFGAPRGAVAPWPRARPQLSTAQAGPDGRLQLRQLCPALPGLRRLPPGGVPFLIEVSF